MKRILPENWIPSDGIQLEKAADDAVRAPGNVCVIAGPGAGKTELLAQKASYLFLTNKCAYPQKILAICFKNDAADNLKKRVVGRCGKEISSRFVSLTYDAFAKSIVDHFRMALPNELIPSVNYTINDSKIIEAAFTKVGFQNIYGLSPGKLKTYFDGEIGKVQLPLNGNLIENEVWKLLIKGFNEYDSCLTFKMISTLAEYIIRTNPQIKKAIQATYSYVFLDEFQDTTQLQYNLVSSCFLNSNTNLTAVGDNKQRIMLWAGALRTAFRDFYNEFKATGLRLVMNHRSAPRLVALQKAMYASLNDTQGNVQIADKWDLDEGEIRLYIADDELVEAKGIANGIIDKIESGIQPNDICILCKQLPQSYATNLINELSNYGMRVRIENDYQDLIKEPVVQLIIAFLQLSMNRKRPEEWEFVVDSLEALNGIGNEYLNDSYRNMLGQLVKKLDELLLCIASPDSIENLINIIENIINYLGIDRLKASFAQYSQSNYLNNCIDKFIELFDGELTLVKDDWGLAIDNFLGKNSIPIMTIHKSKGLEYSAVYFLGLEDSAFWNFKNQPEEDRCSFFVALSRAKLSVAFSFCKYRYSQRSPRQNHNQINEFFELLQSPNMAEIIQLKE